MHRHPKLQCSQHRQHSLPSTPTSSVTRDSIIFTPSVRTTFEYLIMKNGVYTIESCSACRAAKNVSSCDIANCVLSPEGREVGELDLGKTKRKEKNDIASERPPHTPTGKRAKLSFASPSKPEAEAKGQEGPDMALEVNHGLEQGSKHTQTVVMSSVAL